MVGVLVTGSLSILIFNFETDCSNHIPMIAAV